MFIGPVLLLLVVPALQIMFLRESDAVAQPDGAAPSERDW
jgi:hypothetical protein